MGVPFLGTPRLVGCKGKEKENRHCWWVQLQPKSGEPPTLQWRGAVEGSPSRRMARILHGRRHQKKRRLENQ